MDTIVLLNNLLLLDTYTARHFILLDIILLLDSRIVKHYITARHYNAVENSTEGH